LGIDFNISVRFSAAVKKYLCAILKETAINHSLANRLPVGRQAKS